MRYTETQEVIDEKDRKFFFKNFHKAFIMAFFIGVGGFIVLLLDVLFWRNLQHILFYFFIFIAPLVVFLTAYFKFYVELKNKVKYVSKGTVMDKKHIVDILEVNNDGVITYIKTHKYYLFIEGKDEKMEVDEKKFNFFQKNDTIVLYRRNSQYDFIYRYDKNI